MCFGLSGYELRRSVDSKVTIEEIEQGNDFHVVEFKKDFVANIDGGKFRFGDIYIDTLCDDDGDGDE
jgi:hypothetical protein